MPPSKRAEPVALCDGVITALVVRAGRAERVAIHIDGHRAFDVAAVLADRAGLRAGAPLTAEQQQALLDRDAPFRARERAIRLLGVRDRSSGEIDVRLRQSGFDAAIAAETVEWLQGLGYVDDTRFAAAYAAEKRRSGWGPRRIRSELAAKGVGRAVIGEALGAWEDARAGAGDAEEADADVLRLARRRFGGQFAADPEAAGRRLAGFLARRGYDWETIGRVTRSLRDEAGSSDAEVSFDTPAGSPLESPFE